MDELWYETFFSGVALDLWQRAIPESVTTAEVDFLIEELMLVPSAKVLDVPCGLGRHSLTLAELGYQATGIDISAEAIDRVAHDADARGLHLELFCRDMLDLPEAALFDAAFCMGNSFGYLRDENNSQFITSVAQALKPGARFALQTNYAAESLLPTLNHKAWYEISGILLLLDHQYDTGKSRLNTNYTFVHDGIKETRFGSQAVYTAREIRTMLEAAGLRVQAMYGGLDRKPFALGVPDLLIISERS